MSNVLNIVFMGTSSFAVPVLEALFLSKYIHLKAVITQPDRPAGRDHHLRQSPIKECLQGHSFRYLFQPENKNELERCVKEIDSDMILVVSYGMILPTGVLSLPRYGCVNIHASLLPRYRGASPIQEAILFSEKNTGISWIVMDEKMDHGPVIAQESVNIRDDDTTATLSDRLAYTAAKMTPDILTRFAQGELVSHEQDHNNATYTQKITKESGHVDWHKTADDIERMIRAFSPWPGVFCFYHKKRVLIHKANVIPLPEEHKNTPHGTVFLSGRHFPAGVWGGYVAIELESIQREGKAILSGDVFLRGYSNIIGANFYTDGV